MHIFLDTLKRHRALVVLLISTILLACIPFLECYFILGNPWPAIAPTFVDETIYYAHVHTIGEGHFTDGNPYFIEHTDGPPLVIFGGAWINALPMLFGLSFNAALLINFFLWSIAFALACYLLLREMYVPPWLAVLGVLLEYIQFYSHAFRPANLQPVLPFFFLFYAALLRFIKEQSRRNTILLALATGATFYLFAYLWQTVVITLGLLALYALLRREWQLLKATLVASVAGGIIGLPVPLYILLLSKSSPYFWESIARFGLVHTHLPMAEVVYSGGWIGLLLLALAFVYWRAPGARDSEYKHVFLYAIVAGFGLWIMQGSNLLTGTLLETGEHLRELILPWFLLGAVVCAELFWRRREKLGGVVRWIACGAIITFSFASLYYTYYYFKPFLVFNQQRTFWKTEESYAGPLGWLNLHESQPIVVMSDPNDYITPNIPIFSRHFVLFETFAMWDLVPDREFQERYLVAEYFNNPSKQDLENNFEVYMGRQYLHIPPTIAREEVLCKLLHMQQRSVCGTVPTSLEVIGDPFFNELEKKFRTDVKPNIKKYLSKYHVSYILKNDSLDPGWHPEQLGATRVYSDGNFELYKLP